ncbi:polymorphic toxin type 37 domain-containing protein, partial [Alkalimonas sp. NCh-2]|uniref:polymorphic toxin type 37 domain-containing protein n=1 Tax=Alkalimonas sp. NCh-2 TaxID=3144846 RepID=UPI0031F6FFC6
PVFVGGGGATAAGWTAVGGLGFWGTGAVVGAGALAIAVMSSEPKNCPSDVPDFDFDNPEQNPVGSDGVEWPWKGKPPQGGAHGGYKNPNGPHSLHPDLGHGAPIGPHWDFNDRKGPGWRIYPDGSTVPKGK